MAAKRNYGIDFLRLVLMYMVCILHTLGQGGVLKACESGTTSFRVFWFIEILAYCAVDSFAIISGYTAADKPRKFEKLAEMWFQALFYSFVITVMLTIAGLNPDWSIKELIKSALPITYNKFWYFSSFFALYFAIPVINRFVFSIDERTARTALLICFILFSCVELQTGTFNTHQGYSALWLMILYCMGVFAKRGNLFECRETASLLLLWGGCVLLTWFVRVFTGDERLISYVSPTIVASGLIMVVLFSRLNINGRIVQKLSPLAFGIYLFQLNPVIWRLLRGAFAAVAELNPILGVISIFAIAALIFFSGLLVEFVRRGLAKLMQIPALSKKIVSAAGRLLNGVQAAID